MCCKRQLKKKAFVLLLCILPIALAALGWAGKDENSGVKIALWAEGQWSEELAESLKSMDSAFTFYTCSTKEQVQKDVESRKAECGYIFEKDLKEKLDKKDYKRSIHVYTSPATVLEGLTEEVVFSAVIEKYGPELLKNYIDSAGVFSEEGTGQIQELYEKYKNNGSTFSFQYRTETGKQVEEKVKAVFPVRGMGAVFLFVIGLFSGAMLCEDEKKGLYLPISYKKKWIYSLISMVSTTGLAGLSVLISFIFAGQWTGWQEFIFMAGYIGGVALFAALMKAVLRTKEAVSGAIPFFLIGSLALCPVFINTGALVPALKPFQYLFLPYYYLSAF